MQDSRRRRNVKKHNQPFFNARANELSEVRKLIQFLCSVELAIERVVLRLETHVLDLETSKEEMEKALQNLGSEEKIKVELQVGG